MFHECGFTITKGEPRVFDEPQRAQFLPHIEESLNCVVLTNKLLFLMNKVKKNAGVTLMKRIYISVIPVDQDKPFEFLG
jgi:hypothetical protein